MLYLSEQIQLMFQVNVSSHTLSHIMRQVPGVEVITGVSMEEAHVFADPGVIDTYDSKVANQVKNVSREFIVTIDESGFAGFVDVWSERIIAPSDYPHTSVPIPVDRSIKRSTMVSGIVADSGALKPLVIVPRVRAEKELLFWGFQQGSAIQKNSQLKNLTSTCGLSVDM
jgi:hypothetical protein